LVPKGEAAGEVPKLKEVGVVAGEVAEADGSPNTKG
jgi:hypothetical protein